MKAKGILLPDGTILFDFKDVLLVIDHNFVEKYLRTDYKIGLRDNSPFDEPLPCHAYEFTTKKGRKAIRIIEGDTHTYYLRHGEGDTSWDGWYERRPVNAMFARATRESNGGGCWLEVVIMEKGVQAITAEQKEYMDEL